jgi:hypothetical protein
MQYLIPFVVLQGQHVCKVNVYLDIHARKIYSLNPILDMITLNPIYPVHLAVNS